MSTQLVSVFSERLYGDKSFATALEQDPFTTLRNEGFSDLATAAEQDRDRIGELVDRIYATTSSGRRSSRIRLRSSSAGAFRRRRSNRSWPWPVLPAT